jgi:hypothetical protein
MAGEPRGALFAPGKLPAEVERKRRRHGTSCPGGTGFAAGWRFRVFFEDSRSAAPKPARNRQIQQGREQSGPERPICVSCPQTRRNNNHGCCLRKRREQHRGGAGICNKEIAARRAATSVDLSGEILFESVFHAGRRTHRSTGPARGRSELFEQSGQAGVLFDHGGFHGLAHGLARLAARFR